MKKYICDTCGWVYDPEVGDPEGGIEPGTAFEDIPDDWVCPLCGVGKEDFSVVEEWRIDEVNETNKDTELQTYNSSGFSVFLFISLPTD